MTAIYHLCISNSPFISPIRDGISIEIYGGLSSSIGVRRVEVLCHCAFQAFSAQSLQQRYLQLRGEPAATEVTETTELEVEDWKQEALGEEAPSQFSVLTDNLQESLRLRLCG